MASFSPIESESFSGLLCALNLNAPTNSSTLRQLLAKTADASKTPQTPAKAADAPNLVHPPGLQAHQGLSLPEVFAPPPGLAPPAALVPTPALITPKRSRVVKGRKKHVSGSDGHLESDAEMTSVGTGSISLPGSSDDEDNRTVAKELQMNADAPRFEPGWLSDALPSETTYGQQRTALRTPLRKGAVFVPFAAGKALPPRPITGSVKSSSQYKNGELVSIRVEKRTPVLMA